MEKSEEVVKVKKPDKKVKAKIKRYDVTVRHFEQDYYTYNCLKMRFNSFLKDVKYNNSLITNHKEQFNDHTNEIVINLNNIAYHAYHLLGIHFLRLIENNLPIPKRLTSLILSKCCNYVSTKNKKLTEPPQKNTTKSIQKNMSGNDDDDENDDSNDEEDELPISIMEEGDEDVENMEDKYLWYESVQLYRRALPKDFVPPYRDGLNALLNNLVMTMLIATKNHINLNFYNRLRVHLKTITEEKDNAKLHYMTKHILGQRKIDPDYPSKFDNDPDTERIIETFQEKYNYPTSDTVFSDNLRFFIPHYLEMLKTCEIHEKKTFTLFPQKGALIPASIKICNYSLIEILHSYHKKYKIKQLSRPLNFTNMELKKPENTYKVWETYFNIKSITTSNIMFANEITTDGYSVNITTRRFKKPLPYDINDTLMNKYNYIMSEREKAKAERERKAEEKAIREAKEAYEAEQKRLHPPEKRKIRLKGKSKDSDDSSKSIQNQSNDANESNPNIVRNWDRFDNHIGIDPGGNNLYTACDDNGHIVQCSRKEYHNQIGLIHDRELINARKDALECVDGSNWSQKMTQYSFKVSKCETYINNLKHVLELLQENQYEYFKLFYRKLKFQRHIKKKKAFKNMFHKLIGKKNEPIACKEKILSKIKQLEKLKKENNKKLYRQKNDNKFKSKLRKKIKQKKRTYNKQLKQLSEALEKVENKRTGYDETDKSIDFSVPVPHPHLSKNLKRKIKRVKERSKEKQVAKESIIPDDVRNKEHVREPMILIGYGNATCNVSGIKGAHMPVSAFYVFLTKQKGIVVVLLNENMTTKMCFCCQKETSDFKDWHKIKTENGFEVKLTSTYSLRRCKNECRKIWQRDVNASRNCHHVLSTENRGKPRPQYLIRQPKSNGTDKSKTIDPILHQVQKSIVSDVLHPTEQNDKEIFDLKNKLKFLSQSKSKQV